MKNRQMQMQTKKAPNIIEVHSSRGSFDRLTVYHCRRECKGTATLEQPGC